MKTFLRKKFIFTMLAITCILYTGTTVEAAKTVTPINPDSLSVQACTRTIKAAIPQLASKKTSRTGSITTKLLFILASLMTAGASPEVLRTHSQNHCLYPDDQVGCSDLATEVTMFNTFEVYQDLGPDPDFQQEPTDSIVLTEVLDQAQAKGVAELVTALTDVNQQDGPITKAQGRDIAKLAESVQKTLLNNDLSKEDDLFGQFEEKVSLDASDSESIPQYRTIIVGGGVYSDETSESAEQTSHPSIASDSDCDHKPAPTEPPAESSDTQGSDQTGDTQKIIFNADGTMSGQTLEQEIAENNFIPLATAKNNPLDTPPSFLATTVGFVQKVSEDIQNTVENLTEKWKRFTAQRFARQE
jgi:hypothetical protein